MIRSLWGWLALFCVVWLGYVFFKKALALTNTNIFSLLGWAWSEHPKGVVYSLLFYFLFFIAAVFLLVTVQTFGHVLAGQPVVMVYVGDELMNREQRFYAADDAQKRVVKVSTMTGNRLKFSYPTALNNIYTRQLFWVSGAGEEQAHYLANAGPTSSWVTSFFFYVFFGLCMVILHAVARDYMVLEARAVTPMDTVGEFLIVVPVIILVNAALLLTHHWVYHVKAKRVDVAQLQQLEHLSVSPGDVINCRLLDHARVANMGKESGLVGDQAAYYLFELQGAQGVPVTAAIQFGFSSKLQPDIEKFTASMEAVPEVACEVTEHYTLRPVSLQGMKLNWFPSS